MADSSFSVNFIFQNEYGETPADIINGYWGLTFTEEDLPKLYKSGYIFQGWYANDELKVNVGDAYQNVYYGVSNVTDGTILIIARWERLHYITDVALSNIAQSIRYLHGIRKTFTPDEMASYVYIPYDRTASYLYDTIQTYDVEIGAELPDLTDFTYTINSDGSFTITGWKETYQGVSDTKIVVPNNGLITV